MIPEGDAARAPDWPAPPAPSPPSGASRAGPRAVQVLGVAPFWRSHGPRVACPRGRPVWRVAPSPGHTSPDCPARGCSIPALQR